MNAYHKLEEINRDSPIDEKSFDGLKIEFSRTYLGNKNYHQKIELHRNPTEVKWEILQGLYTYLVEMQNRPEMRHIENSISGYVPTRIKDLWMGDRRLKSLYATINQYCYTTSKDFNTIAVHMAEYRALCKLADKIRKSINKDTWTIDIQDGSSRQTSGSKVVERKVFPIHFEDRGGIEFEHLVFAFVFRQKKWDHIEWLGQAGDDGGRDIWAVIENDSYCYQCANYRSLPFEKVRQDIDKLVNNRTIPEHFTVVCGGKIGNKTRKKVKEYALSVGIDQCELWSGIELEEKLRLETPDLIKRFVEGEIFPETSQERMSSPFIAGIDLNEQIAVYRRVFKDTRSALLRNFVPFNCIFNGVNTSTETLSEIIFKQGAVIHGKSGCGKSALAESYAISHLERGVSIFVQAKYYNTHLDALINDEVRAFGFESSLSILYACKTLGKKVLLVIDGINECPTDKRAKLVAELTELLNHYPIKCIVTTQNLEEGYRNLTVAFISIDLPDLEIKKTIANQYCSNKDLKKLEPILKVVSTSLEAKIVGEIGSSGVDDVSRFSLFDVFIRKKLQGLGPLPMLLLSSIAKFLSQNISFSITFRQMESILANNGISESVYQSCISSGLLVQNLTKISFAHEMFMNFFVADSIVRFSRSDSTTIINEIEAPKNHGKRLLIIGSIEDHIVLDEVLTSIVKTDLLVQISLGEAGLYSKIWADNLISDLIPRIEEEIKNLVFRIDSQIGVDIDKASLANWTSQELALIGCIPYLLIKEKKLTEIYHIAEIWDQVYQNVYQELLDEAREKKISLRSGLFSAIFVGIWTARPALTSIYSALHSGFITFDNTNEIKNSTISKLLQSNTPTHGQFFLLLLLCKYDERAQLLFPLIFDALQNKWKFLPYHLKNEILNRVGHCYKNESQRLQLIEAINELHSHEKNAFASTNMFDALTSLGALEDDTVAYQDVVTDQLQKLLITPDKESSWNDAATIFTSQFDHPYDFAFSNAIALLNPSYSKQFYKMALLGTNDTFFTTSLILTAAKTMGFECGQYILKWTDKPKIDGSMPQDDLSVFIISHIALGRIDFEISSKFDDESNSTYKSLFACAEIYYWLNRSNLNIEEKKKRCERPLKVLFSKDSKIIIDCLWQTEHVLLTSSLRHYFDEPVITMLNNVFPENIASSSRMAILNQDSLESLLPFDRKDEVIKHAIRFLARYGNVSDLKLLRELSNHSVFGEAAVEAIKKLDT